MKCPQCEVDITDNTDVQPLIKSARDYAEQNGSGYGTFRCPHCQHNFRIFIERIVRMRKNEKVADDAELGFRRIV
jgi:hypothetical protein